ncbi:PREDICTED: uncharacterized protein LOC108556807 [Nicrophorus vespilloides]|uniref:Uncharacterized protein LOC108556807 n=1 Tax=Nicrophorus vespilloides TaxID=110193 RepID=A0ABM1M1W9_NICVS|nr:PREDICTED: uncharacterized protein LOC108556807 [Nicrophorus vespilloides]
MTMMMFTAVVCVLLATAIPLTQSAVVFSNEVVSPATTYMGVARTPFVDALRRRCPLCDSSVYPYCSEKLFHDSCCCHNPNNAYDRLPYECQYADCSFLHANSCQEHKLISACCCTNLYLHKK